MGIIVKKCCCMELPTAGVVIGWFGAICSVLATIGILFFLFVIDAIKTEKEKESSNYTESYDSEDNNDENSQVNMAITFAAFIVLLIVYIVFFVTSILLIIGTKKQIPGLILPWLITAGVFLIGTVLKLFSESTEQKVSETIGDIFGFCLGVYLWIVIYSLQEHIRNEKRRPPAYPHIQAVPVGMYHA